MADALDSSCSMDVKGREEPEDHCVSGSVSDSSPTITVSQAVPHKPGGLLDTETEASSLQPFLGRYRVVMGLGRVGKIFNTPTRLCLMKSLKGRGKSKYIMWANLQFADKTCDLWGDSF